MRKRFPLHVVEAGENESQQKPAIAAAYVDGLKHILFDIIPLMDLTRTARKNLAEDY